MDDRSLNRRLDRRAFIRGAAALPLVSVAAGSAVALPPAGEAPRPTPAFPGLIVRQDVPSNLEYPFATLDRFITPVERFFVRSHFPEPRIDLNAWRLRVEGAVEREQTLTLDELRRMPSRTVTALLECSGNGRVFLAPRAAGVQWALGAVGNAEWTGVPLAAILERAGVRGAAVEVILEGADGGASADFPPPYRTPGRIQFTRSLPLAKARQADVLLAYRMNGADLTAAHGHPLRVIVPGWYGMASVKWLTRLIVTDRPFRGYFHTVDYAYFERRHGQPSLVTVTELQVKAQIARPYAGEVVPAGRPYRVFGAAWTGESEVDRVEVSSDDGRTWSAARLLERPVAHAWRLWEYEWRVPAQPGPRVLRARAHDRRGRVQPAARDLDRRSWMISHVLPIAVEVR